MGKKNPFFYTAHDLFWISLATIPTPYTASFSSNYKTVTSPDVTEY